MATDPLEPYLPEASWFRHLPGGIHGIPHVTRVLVWAARIAAEIAAPGAIRREELLWAAACHDVGRVDDGTDRGHGTRSAAWVGERLLRVRPETAGLDIAFIQELCTWHEIPDPRIERLSLELVILKDADGLDRVRIHDLDPTRLRLQAAHRLVGAATELERATRFVGAAGGPEILQAAMTLR